MCCFVLFFFFKQRTAYEMRISDWSSDVCSSDLVDARLARVERSAPRAVARPYRKAGTPSPKPSAKPAAAAPAPAPQPAASPAVVQQVEAKRPAGDAIRYP